MKRVPYITLAAVIAAVLILAVILVRRQSDTSSSANSTNAVVITNLKHSAPSFEKENTSAVQKSLYSRIKSYSKNPSKKYEGEIRDGSYRVTNNLYQGSEPSISVPTVEFIVDIPGAKQSYLVKDSGGKKYPFNIIHVLCVSKQQNIYPDYGCKDEPQ